MLTSIYHLFPSTIHPMVVHFTIAFIYLTTLTGAVGWVIRKDDFYRRGFFIMIGLAIVATLATGVAGVISESYVTVTPVVAKMLATHKRDGELTGVLLVVAFALQWWRNRRQPLRVSAVALLFCIAATVMVSITGYIGGSMVYDHGLGVHIPAVAAGTGASAADRG